jgi:hypothetical protein
VKGKNSKNLCVLGLTAVIILSNCATTRQNNFSQYNFSLKNTLSIFLLNNEKGYFFCIPVQYCGDYQISRFEFDNGNIRIGDYDILLKRDEINISVYLNEKADENGSTGGNTVGDFNLIYLEENGRVLASKMTEPAATKIESDWTMNHYYIFIEKYLTDSEMKNIVNEYESGNVYSNLSIWYDLTIDDVEQNGSGMLDDFEFYDGVAADPAWFPANLDFFKAKYLKSATLR